jgi:Asp-tRNA(Asn)/Glu-tRNA(Gln) amidotransferase A subunit family amidase
MAKHFDEATLLALGRAFQAATDWHLKTPAGAP